MSNDLHQPDYVIRKKRPPSWYWSWAGVALAIFLVAMGLGYWLNQKQHTFSDTAKEQFTQLEQQLDNANAGVIHWQQQYNVEHQITLQLQQEMREQQIEIANLRKEHEAFQRIFDPEAIESGLQIASLVWSSAGVSQFNYRLLLIQAKQQNREISGTFAISLIGEQAGEPKNYELTDIGDLNENNSTFKFKYMDSHQGRFSIPEGFSPRFVRVTAKISGRGGKAILQDFTWQSDVEVNSLKQDKQELAQPSDSEQSNITEVEESDVGQ
ncbi:MAG: hypothetical protein HWD86_05175 [Kangiellaceae bacterium]|nr:hypothetical protein [Kangiellaceae bacterium]